MLGAAGRAVQGMHEDAARQVGNYLFSADPAEIQPLTAAFEAAGRGTTDQGQFITRLIAGVTALPKGRPEQREMRR